MDVLFEDNHLLVVNKPGGILTQPSGTTLLNLETLCKQYIKEKYQKEGLVFLEAVHRLDKPVSGIVVFARTSKGLSRLQLSMREGKWKKRYLALVQRKPPKEEALLEHYLLHEEYMSRVVDGSHPKAKKASLYYRCLGEKQGYVLVEIELETGRYHQIRAQLAKIGSPIVGDEKYGFRGAWRGDAIALHHGHLSFPHPISKDDLFFYKEPNWCMQWPCCTIALTT